MRRRVEWWSAGFGACALVGAFYHYTLIVTGFLTKGVVQSVLLNTVNGHENAPYQYRFLVPCVLVWLHDHAGISLESATTAVDGAMLVIGAALGVSLLRRSGLGLFALPALLYCAFFVTGSALAWKPETMTAFACVTATLLAMQRRPLADGWWSDRVACASLAIASIILIGCRTDLLLALGVGFVVRWWQKRERFDLVVAVTLMSTSAVATYTLIRVFSDAHYPPGVAVVQVSFNVEPLTLCVLGAFLLTAVGPLVALRRISPTGTAVRGVASERLPLLALIAAEVAFAFLFGRVNEIRLVFPLGFALAWVGVDLWRAVLSSMELEDHSLSVGMG